MSEEAKGPRPSAGVAPRQPTAAVAGVRPNAAENSRFTRARDHGPHASPVAPGPFVLLMRLSMHGVSSLSRGRRALSPGPRLTVYTHSTKVPPVKRNHRRPSVVDGLQRTLKPLPKRPMCGAHKPQARTTAFSKEQLIVAPRDTPQHPRRSSSVVRQFSTPPPRRRLRASPTTGSYRFR